jgi:L-arabinose isomerase
MSERKPRIGILGIMQDLYDDMIPGIAQRQEGYAAELAAHLADAGEFIPSKPIKYREDAERAMRQFEDSDLDGIMVVMLTYGPAMRVARLLSETQLPVLLANIQPEPNVTPAWDMDDMTYNQGVHGAQDTANAMVRGGKRFAVLTDDWKSDSFLQDVTRWARAAATVTRWKSLKTAIFGYAMNDMGDIRWTSPRWWIARPGNSRGRAGRHVPGMLRSPTPRRTRSSRSRTRTSRSTRGCPPRSALTTPDAGSHRAIPTGRGFGRVHRPFRRDRRRRPVQLLPLAAASSLMAGVRLRGRGGRADRLHGLRRASAHRRRALHRDVRDGLPDRLLILQSHVGEGNWKVARKDKPVRADQATAGDRAAGRPAPRSCSSCSPARPHSSGHPGVAGGDAVPAGLRRGREPGQPGTARAGDALYGQFRLHSGRAGLPERLAGAGGPHHEVMNLGHHAADWKVFCQLAGIEFVQALALQRRCAGQPSTDWPAHAGHR